MKAVMISIKPKWCEKIANGNKTIEVRKTRPKIDTPFKCYIYCTQDFKFNDFKYSLNFIEAYKRSGKVIGEFVCDRITDISVSVRNCNEDYNHVYHNDECKGSCLTWKELQEYGQGETLYGWHISDLVIYDEPKELSEFIRPCDRFLDCITCKRLVRNDYLSCDNKIIRPPQSWCYVEEKGVER